MERLRPTTLPPRLRTRVDARDSALDARGSALDARGSVLDARGSVLDARGSALDARGSALDARWRALVLRWWRAHAQHAPPPRHTQLFFYDTEDFQDMMRLNRLVRAEWSTRDPQLQRGPAGGAGGAVGTLLMLLGVLLVVLLALGRLAARARSGRSGACSVPAVSGCRVEDLESDELEPSPDQPPPYALVADAGADAGPKPGLEEPPPPYSECFVDLKGAREPPREVGADNGDVPSVGIAPKETLGALCGCCECDLLRRGGAPGSGDAVETCV